MKSSFCFLKSSTFNLVLFLLSIILFSGTTNKNPEISIVTEKNPGVAASHGLAKLTEALVEKNIIFEKVGSVSDAKGKSVIVAGLANGDGNAAQILKEENLTVPQVPEALAIWKTDWQQKPVWVISGFDDRGLMYGMLDVASRIGWSTNSKTPLSELKEIIEKPDVSERAISIGTFQRKYFEERFYDTIYWEKYFDMMAENRLNQFLLIFGYKNNQYLEPNFVAPVYPNFFDVDEHPYVKMSGITAVQQQKNTEALKKIITLAHERGIEFGVGLWDQIERDGKYTAMVKDDREMPADLPENIIWGLSQENLISYTKVAIRKFFQTFPEIDLVQFRMHWEAGITGEVALKFWDEIFNLLKEECPDIKIEARAKDVPDETFYDGVKTGTDFRVATKHWMEQMGMPFHPTHINKDNQYDRRHGYADMLRYPKQYGFKWRVWNGGTTRVFLWGDPNWVRTFAEGSHLYDAVGYEFNEPLYFKMNGSKHDAAVTELLNPEYRYYTYEFERYWHFYQVIGRMGYNPNTPSDVWEMEFQQRFGKEAGDFLMQGLHDASKVLPRIVSASYLYSRFPSPQGWPELQRMENLQHFALNSTPTDIQQFASPMEEAEQILNGGFSVKRLPSQTSEWFKNISAGILEDVDKAEIAIGKNRSKEYISTITDLKMLANLAQYHSQRLLAAVQYNLYDKTGSWVAFDKAIAFETSAVNAYERMVEAAGNVYNKQLDFGSNKVLFPGHWDKEYQRLVEELKELNASRKALQTSAEKKHLIVHIPIKRALLKEPIKIAATVQTETGLKEVRVLYSTDDNPFKAVKMKSSGEGIYSGEIPGIGIEKNLQYYLEIIDKAGKNYYLPKKAMESPYSVTVSNDREAPVVEMERIATAKLNKKLKVSAKVEDASGVQRVALRYRRVNQFEDYQSVQMVYNASSRKYEAQIPAGFFDGKYDVMYFIEAMDTKGNGKMYPDMEVEKPYVIVHLDR